MPRKVVFTETVTAELLPSMPPLRSADPGEPERQAGFEAVAGAVAAVGVSVEGVAPSLSLGEQMVALSTALGHAAHNATAQQHSVVTLTGATTVRAVSSILGAVPRRRPRPA